MGKHRLNKKKRAAGEQWSAQVVVEGQQRAGQWPPHRHAAPDVNTEPAHLLRNDRVRQEVAS